jgi:Domain of unknown function DUF11
MRRRVSWLLGMALVLVFALAGSAGADATLGSTTEPSGAEADVCFPGGSGNPDVIAQITDDPTTPYTVPSGGGEISSWSTATAGDTAGTPLTLVAVRAEGGHQYAVVGADSETLPTPLPPAGVATFTVAHPIVVQGGDILGLYSSDTGLDAPVCLWDWNGNSGSVPFDDSVTALTEPASPAPGQSLQTDSSLGPSGFGYMLDVSALVAERQNVGVITTATPSRGAAHLPMLLSSTVTNGGPSSAPITFTDKVPSGLAVDSAAAGQGTCATKAQTVTCTITGLQAGQSAPVNVVVTPTRSGNFVNGVSVSAPFPDPTPGNNSASAMLAVGTPATSGCVIPKLRNTPSSVARAVLKELNCKVRVTRRHSKRVHKGNVIATRPGPSRHPAGTRVKLVVSSGRKP